MIKPASSLLTKILFWFFLNLAIVGTALAVFFAFQPHINLYAIFGQEGSDRLRTASLLIAHDLAQAGRANWAGILARYASIHQVDFAIILEDGSHFSSREMNVPDEVINRVKNVLTPKHPPGRFPPPHLLGGTQGRQNDNSFHNDRALLEQGPIRGRPPKHDPPPDKMSHLTMTTENPTRYWTGIIIPPLPPHNPAVFLAVSESITGNGFFFDPFPWIFVASAMLLISVLFWIPMVRSITRPISRLTYATEEIAKGRFDLSIHEPRVDEIGRLAKAVNHMTSRLSAFVKGQKRFLGDVAHELGSPIARIQFGLGALEQRVEGENRKRVSDVMEEVDHMAKLTNELLAFSRAEMNIKSVKLETVDLLPLVQTAVSREVTPKVEIIVQIDPEIRVVASTGLLTRAIANLLRNAIKYAGESSPIYVTAEKRKDKVSIKVRDSGPGVPEDLLDQLFEPFFRPEPSRNRDSGGVGLGLSIVKTCIETCKGNVSAANLKPNGFSVTITLNT